MRAGRRCRYAVLPWLALAAVVWVAGSGCKAKPAVGGACRVVDQLACAGHEQALVCEGAAGALTWVAVPCRGSLGCSHRSDEDECDDTVAAREDACPHNPPLDYACSADHADALVCKDGRFSLWRACRGPDGCVVDGRNIRCDTSLGQPGDPCERSSVYACQADGQAMLECDGATMAVASSCRGPRGCRSDVATRKVDCDDAMALEGDPCEQPKRIACAVDGKAELTCREGKYVKRRECRRSDCTLEGTEVHCD